MKVTTQQAASMRANRDTTPSPPLVITPTTPQSIASGVQPQASSKPTLFENTPPSATEGSSRVENQFQGPSAIASNMSGVPTSESHPELRFPQALSKSKARKQPTHLPERLYTAQSASDCRRTATLERVINGTFEGEHASYVELLLSFGKAKIVRSCTARIYVNSTDGSTPALPMIHRFRPKTLHGQTSDMTQTRSTSVSGGMTAGQPDLASGNVEASVEQSTERQLKGRFSLQALLRWRGRSRADGTVYILEITMQEDEIQKCGIRFELPIGIILVHGQRPYEIATKIEINRKMRDRIGLHLPFSRESKFSIVLDGFTNYLQRTASDIWLSRAEGANADFNTWSSDDWRRLIAYKLLPTDDAGIAYADR